MIGGNGNDTYVVDNASAMWSPRAAAGTDTVQSSLSYTLGANVENLTLTGAAAINATGNSLNNVLTGNGADNVFNGGAGGDSFVGGGGNDTVTYETAAAGIFFHLNQSAGTYTGEAAGDTFNSIEIIRGRASLMT